MQYLMAEQGILEVEAAHIFVNKPESYDHSRMAWKSEEEMARNWTCYLRDRISGKQYELKRGTREQCHALKEAIGEFLSSDIRCVPITLIEMKAEDILKEGLIVPLKPEPKKEDDDG